MFIVMVFIHIEIHCNPKYSPHWPMVNGCLKLARHFFHKKELQWTLSDAKKFFGMQILFSFNHFLPYSFHSYAFSVVMQCNYRSLKYNKYSKEQKLLSRLTGKVASNTIEKLVLNLLQLLLVNVTIHGTILCTIHSSNSYLLLHTQVCMHVL